MELILYGSGWVWDFPLGFFFVLKIPLFPWPKPSLPSPPTLATVLAMKAAAVEVIVLFIFFFCCFPSATD